MPWAKRGVLMREVRDRLIEDARQQGKRLPADANTQTLEAAALRDENKLRTLQILADALDKVVVTTRIEEENARLRRENEALREQIERTKRESGRKK